MLCRLAFFPIDIGLLRDNIHLWQFSASKEYDSLHAYDGVLARPCDRNQWVSLLYRGHDSRGKPSHSLVCYQ
jgi:hypothetical protein